MYNGCKCNCVTFIYNMLVGFEQYLEKYLKTILLNVCGPMAQVDTSEIDRKSPCDQSVNKSHNF